MTHSKMFSLMCLQGWVSEPVLLPAWAILQPSLPGSEQPNHCSTYFTFDMGSEQPRNSSDVFAGEPVYKEILSIPVTLCLKQNWQSNQTWNCEDVPKKNVRYKDTTHHTCLPFRLNSNTYRENLEIEPHSDNRSLEKQCNSFRTDLRSSRIWVIYIQHSLQIEQQVTTGHFHISILVIFSSSLGSNSWQVSNLFDTPKSGGHLLTKVQHPIFSRLNFNGVTHPIMWPDLTHGAWLCTGVFQWQQFVKQDMSPRALYSLFSFLRWLRWRVLLNLLILMVIRKTSNWSWPFWALLYSHSCRRPSQAHYCIASWKEHELQNSCSGRFANSLDQVYTSDEGFLKVEFTRTFMFSTTLWVCTFSHDAGWNS